MRFQYCWTSCFLLYIFHYYMVFINSQATAVLSQFVTRYMPFLNVFKSFYLKMSINSAFREQQFSKSPLPPPGQPSGRVLALSAGGPGFNPPTRTASYQRRNKNGTSSSLVWHSTLKSKYWLFLKNKDRKKNVMDKIWDRNPSKSEVIGRCGRG